MWMVFIDRLLVVILTADAWPSFMRTSRSKRFFDGFPPPRNGACLESEQVEHTAERVIYHLFERLRPGIERGNGRRHDGAHLGHGGHVAQMRQRERCLAREQDKRPAFFQRYVGCS